MVVFNKLHLHCLSEIMGQERRRCASVSARWSLIVMKSVRGPWGNALTASYQCQKKKKSFHYSCADPAIYTLVLDSLQCGGSRAFHTEGRVGKYVTSLNLKSVVEITLHWYLRQTIKGAVPDFTSKCYKKLLGRKTDSVM